MYNLSEQISRTHAAGVETFMTLANATFGGAERLAALNLNAARSVLENNVLNTRALMAGEDVQSFVSLQSALATPGSEKALTYSRRVYEITAQTQEALSQAVNERLSELNKNLDQALEKVAKGAPAGADLAVNAARATLAAANSAYSSINEAAKQATGLAEANLAAALALAAKSSRKNG